MWEEQASTSPPPVKSKKAFDKKLLIYGACGLIIVGLVIVSGYFFLQYQNAQKLLVSGGSQSEVQKLVDKVGKLVELPEGEKPTLATVTDKFKVNHQEFFKKAENGDQVLIYEKSKVAIIYRPASNKIVNYATGVSIGQGSTTPTPAVAEVSAAPSESPTPTSAPIPTKALPIGSPTITSSPTTTPTP